MLNDGRPKFTPPSLGTGSLPVPDGASQASTLAAWSHERDAEPPSVQSVFPATVWQRMERAAG